MSIFGKKTKNGEDESRSIRKESKKVIKRTVQELLDFEGITVDGIIYSNGYYSKLYKIEDANFVTEPEDEQFDMIVNYTKLINKFPDNVNVSIVIINRFVTQAQLAEAYHIIEKNDENDKYRADYNKIIDSKIEDGGNSISKDKYILLSVKEKNLGNAKSTFSVCDSELNDAVKNINSVGIETCDGIKRLEVMAGVLKGTNGVSFRTEYSKFIDSVTDIEGNTREELSLAKLKKSGTSVKDIIAPPVIHRDKMCLMLGEERYCKSVTFSNLPTSLDTSFLTNLTNLPYEMVTVVQFKAVPRSRALNLVKNQNVSIKADVIKAEQAAFRGGYSPDLINEDLQLAKEQSQKLRKDIVEEGKKLFFTTMVSTIFADSIDKLDHNFELYKSTCSDYSITPFQLFGQQISGLNTSCLCGCSKVIIDRMLTSDDACALFPFNIQELRDKRGYFYGTNALSKNMIMYDRKRSRLPNGLIFGQSGSGKSFITKGEIIANYLSTDDVIIILDPENEYRVLGDTFNGTIIDLELTSDLYINPCDMSMEWGDRKAAPLVEKCDYMVGLVESILGRGRTCNAYEVSAINRACRAIYEPYINEMTRRHKEGLDNDELDTTICPTLVDFHEALMNDGTTDGHKLALAIEPYCIGSFNLFAHRTNIETNNKLIIFNLLSLPETMREVAMKVCFTNIWNKIVKNKEDNRINRTNRGIWVYLDEFHLFFSTERSANTIMTYFKRVRKYGGIMTGITQDVDDLLRTSQGQAMFSNSGFFIFLHQESIGRIKLQNLYQIPNSLLQYLKAEEGIGLIYNGSVMIPFNYRIPMSSLLFPIMSTNPNDIEYEKAMEAKKAKVNS